MWKKYHNEFKPNMEFYHPSTSYFFGQRPMLIPVHFPEAWKWDSKYKHTELWSTLF